MPPSDDFRAALRAGKLEEAFLLAMGRATELEVTTWVVPAGSGPAAPALLAPQPGRRLRTRIDLLQGDIENEVGDRFLRDRQYQELRQFHREQVGRGSEIIAQNIESLRRLFDVLRALHSSTAIAPPKELAPPDELAPPEELAPSDEFALPDDTLLPSSADWATLPDSHPAPSCREMLPEVPTEADEPDADSVPAEWTAWASQELEGDRAAPVSEGESSAVSWGDAQATAWLDELVAPSERQPARESPPPLPDPWTRPAPEPPAESALPPPAAPQPAASSSDERAAAMPAPEPPPETTLDDLFRDLAGDRPESAELAEPDSDLGGDEQAWDDFVAFVEADSLDPPSDPTPSSYPELAENADWGEWFADESTAEPEQPSATAAVEPPEIAPFPKVREEDWETFTPEPFEPEPSVSLESSLSEMAERDFFRANFLVDEPPRFRAASPQENRPNPS